MEHAVKLINDLAAILDHAGPAAGFTTRREWKSSNHRRLDLVWLHRSQSRRPVVSFEFEQGRAVCVLGSPD